MGAPLGNQNAAKGKRWQQAIDRALERRSRKSQVDELDRLAEIFLDAVESMTVGNEKRGPSIAGFAELGDRMDGKATQVLAGDPDGAPLQVTLMKFTEAE